MNERITREGPVDDTDVLIFGLVLTARLFGILIGGASTGLFLLSFVFQDLSAARGLLALVTAVCLVLAVATDAVIRGTEHGRTASDSLINTLANGLIIAVIVAVIAGVVTLLLGLINRFTPTPGAVNAIVAGVYLMAIVYVIVGIICAVLADNRDARDEGG